MTVPVDGVPAGREARPWSAALPAMSISLGGGILLGVAWAMLAPAAAGRAGAGEGEAARDVTFGLLGVLAGVITAVVLLIWPGRRPAAHAAVVLGAAILASPLAWGVGRLLGAYTLQAVALVVVWPLVAAAVTMIRSLVSVLFGSS